MPSIEQWRQETASSQLCDESAGTAAFDLQEAILAQINLADISALPDSPVTEQ